MKIKKLFLLACSVCCVANATYGTELTRATIQSPDGKNVVTVYQETTDGTIYYKMVRAEKLFIDKSYLGMTTNDGDFTKYINYKGTSSQAIDETYPMRTGKFSQIHNSCNEATISFALSSGQAMDVIFRVYDDGIAYRYYFKGSSKTDFKITADKSEINIPSFKRCWGQKWTYDYSQGYKEFSWSEATALEGNDSRLGNGAFAAPLLVESSLGIGYYALLTDAAVDQWFSRAPVRANGDTGHFTFVPRGTKSNGLDVTTTRPLKTPWRCAIVGRLTDIAVTNLCENVTDATQKDPTGKNWEWVKPGFSSWDWGGQQGGDLKNRTDFELAKQYIDFAAYMGWQYFTLDEGWRNCTYNGSMENYVKGIIDYAKSKGISVWLWNNQGGFNNGLSGYRQMLKQFHDWGAVGAKVDFFYDGDTRGVMEKQELIVQAAAENQIMVNFHGCPTPTGLTRKWPNLVAYEAVDGNEDYFTGGWNNTGTDAGYNGMLVLMRNAVGPMDYTICEFRTGTNGTGTIRDNTTVAHQLATMVTMECGVQFIADAPKNIQGQKWENAMKDVPAAWDESICLEAYIGPKGAKDKSGNDDEDCNLTMARRDKTSWFVGRTVNRESTYSLDCSFLGEGTYTATIWRDNSADTQKDVLVSQTQKNVTKSTKISIRCYALGGFFVRFDRTDIDNYVDPNWSSAGNSYEAEDGKLQGDGAAVTKDLQASGSNMVSGLGQGNWVNIDYGTPYAGNHTIEVNYTSEGDRPLTVAIGDYSITQNCPSTGSFKVRNGRGTITYVMPFSAGRNTIRLGHDTAECPYIDNIFVKYTPNAEITDGIINYNCETKAMSRGLFDLQGHPLNDTPKHGLYINNGKKYIAR